MVDESGSIPLHCGVHHQVIIYSEHVASNSLVIIKLLTIVSQDGPDLLPSIFNDLK